MNSKITFDDLEISVKELQTISLSTLLNTCGQGEDNGLCMILSFDEKNKTIFIKRTDGSCKEIFKFILAINASSTVVIFIRPDVEPTESDWHFKNEMIFLAKCFDINVTDIFIRNHSGNITSLYSVGGSS